MENLFGEQEPAKIKNLKSKSGSLTINPCIAVYGKGPEGTRCKSCSHLFAKNFGKKYYKCDLRKCSGGPYTDHRVNFPTCGKFVNNSEK